MIPRGCLDGAPNVCPSTRGCPQTPPKKKIPTRPKAFTMTGVTCIECRGRTANPLLGLLQAVWAISAAANLVAVLGQKRGSPPTVYSRAAVGVVVKTTKFGPPNRRCGCWCPWIAEKEPKLALVDQKGNRNGQRETLRDPGSLVLRQKLVGSGRGRGRPRKSIGAEDRTRLLTVRLPCAPPAPFSAFPPPCRPVIQRAPDAAADDCPLALLVRSMEDLPCERPAAPSFSSSISASLVMASADSCGTGRGQVWGGDRGQG